MLHNRQMIKKRERALRQEIVQVHRRLYDWGFSVVNDGNTSVRLDENKVLVTPKGFDKAKLKPKQIALVDMTGKPIQGPFAPSSELPVHLAVYQTRPEINAVIHAHPPFCIALSLAGISLEEYLLPEVIVYLKTIPTTPYVTPTTEEAGKAVSALIKNHDALILSRHGSVTVGKDLSQAMARLERMEHTAKIVAIARSIGKIDPLPKFEVDRLLQMA